MRLIDADELTLSHCKECLLYPDKCVKDRCDWHSIAHINMMPTVEAELVRHGKWIYAENLDGFDGYRCSHCMTHFAVDDVSEYHYCPSCGAKMVAQEKDDDRKTD